MNEYKYIRLYHHNIGDLNDIIENVANISSPLINENRHSDVVASDRNCNNAINNRARYNGLYLIILSHKYCTYS